MESTYFQKRIALLEQLGSKGSFDGITKLIRALSFYLTELNPAYDYNESYLNNLTPDFINILKEIQVRRKIANAVFLKASERPLFGASIRITIDNIWEIRLRRTRLKWWKRGA